MNENYDPFASLHDDAAVPIESVDDRINRLGHSESVAPKVALDTTDTGMPPDPRLFTAEYWASRDLAKPDYILSDLLTTTSRMLLIGPTGIGKTNFAMAAAFAIASAASFLHWTGRRTARVLYIDGEMSARLTKDRVQQAIDRHGSMPDTLWVINREDFPDMPQLNSEKGQKFIERLVEQLDGVDLIVFDNIQALLVGSLKEDLTWEPVLPWIRKLTAMKIGQLWMDHTGHATDRGYGDKTREWQFDTVALMKAPETSTADRLLEFRLEFTKARERGPTNRADFETVDIWLDEGDAWQSTASPAKAGKRSKKGLSPEYLKAFDYLSDTMADHGEFVSTKDIPRGTKVVRLDHWRARLKQRGLHEEGENGKKWFQRVRAALIANERIVINEQYVWVVNP